MPLQQLTEPSAEPLSLAQAKQHLRITTSDEDGFVTAAIAAARAACETRSQNQILASRWKLVLDSFPGPSLMGVPFGKPYSLPAHAIVIPKAPVLQVVSIQYTDMGGIAQTMPVTDYVVDLSAAPARITPPFGKIWPIPLPQIGAVVVTFDAGYAAPLTADANADTITVPGWKTLAVNDAIRVSNRDEAAVADGALPAPLVALTDFFVRTAPGGNVYTLSASAGGGVLDITNAGTGKSFIGTIPAALRSWMLLAIGSLYENRESVSVDTRITQAEIPQDFREGLLDPFRLVLY